MGAILSVCLSVSPSVSVCSSVTTVSASYLKHETCNKNLLPFTEELYPRIEWPLSIRDQGH